jgi:hypothetical protein
MSRHPHTRRSPRSVPLLIILVGLVLALCAAVVAPLANAAPVLEGSLSMTSDEGDYIGQGQTWSYDSSAGDVFGVTTTAGTVEGNVQAANGEWWYMQFAAPQGETLATGSYDGATRYAFHEPSGPGLDVFGEGRGCNTLTGSFTVTQIAFDDAGAVQRFDADFVQHCEGAEPALRGHVRLVKAPTPPPLTIGLTLASGGRADRAGGTATVSGTITCSKPATVWLTGTLTQRANRFAQATGTFNRPLQCDGKTAWDATLRSSNSVPFGAGSAQLSVDASAFDPDASQPTTASASKTVKLTR